MSITNELELLSKETFGKGYNNLTNYEKQVVLTINNLNEVVDHTDYLLFKQDNIFEIKKQ